MLFLGLGRERESGGGLDFPLVAGIITTETRKELYYGSFLESDGGNSTLGFFTSDQTKYTYLGIWYTNDPQQRKVWVANPDTPLDNTTAALTIDNTTEILKITSGGNTVFNISNQLAANPTAKIEDTGAFTMGWEPTPDSGQLVIYRRGESYWTSGPLKVNGLYNLSFVSNDDENYLTFCDIVDGRLWELRPDSRIEECRSSNDKFEEKRAPFLPSIATSEYDENSSLSIKDCMEMCWNDCNCVAFAVNSNGTGCITWIEKLEY
ncbi:hypothetical protein Vadar_000673 [Vaccinium darrowii]|uniref:Uncharacterized protein n=1 Tax=Vaccinium darrowii TaxID=229202 RepID=A0ACB7Z930_9ERIC|nr:hypothetical protein Vadar_000673 [Vaccinium darrowii]